MPAGPFLDRPCIVHAARFDGTNGAVPENRTSPSFQSFGEIKPLVRPPQSSDSRDVEFVVSNQMFGTLRYEPQEDVEFYQAGGYTSTLQRSACDPCRARKVGSYFF